MQLKTVIFDLDDTLYTDWHSCDQAGLLAVAAYGTQQLGLKAEVSLRAFQEGRAQALRQLGPVGSCHNRTLFAQFGLERLGINPLAHAENVHDAYWQAVFHTMALDPAIPALFDALRNRFITIAICTNMMANIQMRKLNYLGIAEKIDCFVSSEEAGIDKPAPEIFSYTLQKAGCSAQQAVMVGDSYAHDMTGAHAAGLSCIWVNRAGQPVPNGADASIMSVRSMEAAAERLMQMIES